MMIQEAEKTVKKLLLAGTPIVIGFSGGQDSGATLNLALAMAAEIKREGRSPALGDHSWRYGN